MPPGLCGELFADLLQGDSGGPLHFVTDGIYKQIGITSFGSSLGCEIGSHAGFTRVASYLQWISEKSGLVIQP